MVLAGPSAASEANSSASASLAGPSAAPEANSSASVSLGGSTAVAEENAPAPASLADPGAAKPTLAQVWLGFLCAQPRARFLKRCFAVLYKSWHDRACSNRDLRCAPLNWKTYQPLWMENVNLVSVVLRERGMLGAVQLLPPAAVVPLPAWLRPESWEDRLGTRDGNYGYHTPSPIELVSTYSCVAVTLWTARQGWTTRMREEIRKLYAGPKSPWTSGVSTILCKLRVDVKVAVCRWREVLLPVYPSGAVFRVLASALSILDAGWADHVLHGELAHAGDAPIGDQPGIVAFAVLLFAWQWEFFEYIAWRPELLEFADPDALRSDTRRPAKLLFAGLVNRFAASAPQAREG